MTTKTKPEEATPDLRILKVGTCPSLTGASTLTYHTGCTSDGEIHFRIWANTGGGLHGREWVAWSAVQPALETDKVTSGTLRTLFRGKSRNTPGFLLAVLKAEGLVEPLGEQGHTKADPRAFLAQMKSLIASDTQVHSPVKAPVKPVRKVSR